MTVGYPSLEDTVPILLAMQNGGAAIIELGVPFSDAATASAAIQKTNLVCDVFFAETKLLLIV